LSLKAATSLPVPHCGLRNERCHRACALPSLWTSLGLGGAQDPPWRRGLPHGGTRAQALHSSASRRKARAPIEGCVGSKTADGSPQLVGAISGDRPGRAEPVTAPSLGTGARVSRPKCDATAVAPSPAGGDFMHTGVPGKCCQISPKKWRVSNPAPFPRCMRAAPMSVSSARRKTTPPRGGFSAPGSARTRFELGVVGVPHPR
jgi:hypothetical protein